MRCDCADTVEMVIQKPLLDDRLIGRFVLAHECASSGSYVLNLFCRWFIFGSRFLLSLAWYGCNLVDFFFLLRAHRRAWERLFCFLGILGNLCLFGGLSGRLRRLGGLIRQDHIGMISLSDTDGCHTTGNVG